MTVPQNILDALNAAEAAKEAADTAVSEHAIADTNLVMVTDNSHAAVKAAADKANNDIAVAANAEQDANNKVVIALKTESDETDILNAAIKAYFNA